MSGVPFKVSLQPVPVVQWEIKTEPNLNGSLWHIIIISIIAYKKYVIFNANIKYLFV